MGGDSESRYVRRHVDLLSETVYQMIFAASTKTSVSGGFAEAFSGFKAAFTDFAEV